MKSGRSHQRKQTESFECDRFSSGIRTCYHKSVEFFAERDVICYYLLFGDKRVSCPFQFNYAFIVKQRFGSVIVKGKLSLAEDKVKLNNDVKICSDRLGVFRDLCRKLRKNTLYFRFFTVDKLAYFVICADHTHRLNKQCCAA